MRPLYFLIACCLLLIVVQPGLGQTRIVCVGDSITYGYVRGGSPAAVGGSDDGYLPHLKRWLDAKVGPHEIINRGQLGENTVSGLARINSVLSSTSPNIVIIMYGTNDVSEIFRYGPAHGGIPAIIANLSGMISAVQARGARPILATIIPRYGGPDDADNAVTGALNSSIRGLANARGVTVADQERTFRGVDLGTFYSDTFHPNTSGYQLMAEQFAATLAGRSAASIDLVSPVITSVTPWPGSVTAGPNGPIRLTIQEYGSALDPASFALVVNDVLVEPFVAIRATQLTAEFTPEPGWSLGQRISVAVSVSDLGDPPNITDTSYWFRVSAGNGTGGDIDRSGRVDGADMIILGLAFGSVWGDERYRYAADIDANLVIDGNDLAMIAAAFGSDA